MTASSNLKSLLLTNKLKVTPQRLVVYGALYALRHATAEQIIEKVATVVPSISVATIYNVLDCFTSHNIISKINTSNNKMLFDINTKQHLHLVDIDNGEISDYMNEELDALIADYFEKKKIDSFQIEKLEISLVGKFINNNR